jgi:hypothetical protein
MTENLKFLGKTRYSLKKGLSKEEFEFLENVLNSFTRILPHIENTGWKKVKTINEKSISKSSAWWTKLDGKQRRAIGVRMFIKKLDVHIETKFKRKVVPRTIADARTPDNTEMNICKTIVTIAANGLLNIDSSADIKFTYQMIRSFDDFVILEHLKQSHKLTYDLGALIEFFRDLSEQSYENSSLSFGVIIDKRKKVLVDGDKIFPNDYLHDPTSKKYRAFTDGYRSAFLLDSVGRVGGLIDLEAEAKVKSALRGEHYFPEWCRNIALCSTRNRIGLSLTRQGDILYFEHGSLKFTRRFGRWQYWNHAYNIEILKTMARAQKVKPNILGKVTSYLYKYALDISFRHSGGLFVILRNKNEIHSIVRDGDSLKDVKRSEVKKQFDRFLDGKSILGIDRNVILELASIDGALVFSNHGGLLAYGAILSPKRRQNINSAEGSRSKAAIGASHFGVAIKISSDGDITIYEAGQKFIQI